MHVNMTIAGKIATAEDAARYVEGGSGLSAIGGSAGGPTCPKRCAPRVLHSRNVKRRVSLSSPLRPLPSTRLNHNTGDLGNFSVAC